MIGLLFIMLPNSVNVVKDCQTPSCVRTSAQAPFVYNTKQRMCSRLEKAYNYFPCIGLLYWTRSKYLLSGPLPLFMLHIKLFC